MSDDINAETADCTQSAFGGIKTFVLRAGRMTESQRKEYADLHSRWCVPFSGQQIDLSAVFGNNAPVTVEIGFGMGAATTGIAEQNPQNNYLGMEVHRPGVGRLLGNIRRLDLHNVRIIEHDALETLELMIPDNSVAAFHVFFPDPWPKKKHHKRRLAQRPHTDLLAKKLIPGGYVYMVTDWQPYADSALEQFSQTPGLKNRYESFAPPQTWRPETRFEQKGKQANRAINELYFIKKQEQINE